MKIPVYQWGTREVQEQEIPIPMVGDTPAKGAIYRLIDGFMVEKVPVPAMNLMEFMEIYPDSICKKIITNTIPAVYHFESPEHGVAIYLQHAPISGE